MERILFRAGGVGPQKKGRGSSPTCQKTREEPATGSAHFEWHLPKRETRPGEEPFRMAFSVQEQAGFLCIRPQERRIGALLFGPVLSRAFPSTALIFDPEVLLSAEFSILGINKHSSFLLK